LPKGELLSVLGPSGCGKTTLLNIVAGFLAPTDGQVTLNGQEGHRPGPERGMVFQQGALFEWMSVRATSRFGPDMGQAEIGMGEIVDHLLDGRAAGFQGKDDLRAVGRHAAACGAGALSCQRSRRDPDGRTAWRARRADPREDAGLVLKLWKETGKTIILITHSVEEALLLGERLLVMAPRPGRIHKEYRCPFADGRGRPARGQEGT
jgi:taurine transport system ATP-binding protein